jgi:hypothetical protein
MATAAGGAAGASGGGGGEYRAQLFANETEHREFLAALEAQSGGLSSRQLAIPKFYFGHATTANDTAQHKLRMVARQHHHEAKTVDIIDNTELQMLWQKLSQATGNPGMTPSEATGDQRQVRAVLFLFSVFVITYSFPWTRRSWTTSSFSHAGGACVRTAQSLTPSSRPPSS